MSVPAGAAADRGAGRPAEDGGPQASAPGGRPGLSAVCAPPCPGTSGDGGRWRGGPQGRGATAGAGGAAGAVSTMAKGVTPEARGGEPVREDMHGVGAAHGAGAGGGFRTLTVRHRAGTAPDRNFPPPREPPCHR
ncbi:hypothetical protein Srubr_65260 [Streptomyces rubradiris]|uniref:Uncharacterized protein n=1 Tax=Streptomyces rubradiris TaxID=285531 RepID=A0ABQ3RLE2_STRRR|nr:hypothetical protein Srubr_65260 [Streptomyces rubradiris]